MCVCVPRRYSFKSGAFSTLSHIHTDNERPVCSANITTTATTTITIIVKAATAAATAALVTEKQKENTHRDHTNVKLNIVCAYKFLSSIRLLWLSSFSLIPRIFHCFYAVCALLLFIRPFLLKLFYFSFSYFAFPVSILLPPFLVRSLFFFFVLPLMKCF